MPERERSASSTTAHGHRSDLSSLLEVLPQVGAQRHAVDQIVDVTGFPTLDGPVPLMVEQLVDVLQLLDALIPVAEQVIDVPKIFVERIPSRTSVREPQLAEQLVEVPTLISYSSFREIVEQNVDIQFLMVVMVFSVYTQDRVLQRLVEQIIVQ